MWRGWQSEGKARRDGDGDMTREGIT
jgi:hypothetical protein